MFKKVLILLLSFIFGILGALGVIEFYHFKNDVTFVIAFFYCIPMTVVIDLLFTKNDKFIKTIVLPRMLGWTIPLTVVLTIFPFAAIIVNFVFSVLNITNTQPTLKILVETFLIMGSFLMTLVIINPKYKKIYQLFMKYFGDQAQVTEKE